VFQGSGPRWLASISQQTWCCYATAYDNGGCSAPHNFTRGDRLDDLRWVCLPTANCRLTTLDWLSQSRNYFTTNGLPPINSSWHQAPWGSDPEFFIYFIFHLQLNPCGHSLYVTSSLKTGWGCLLWIDFVFVKCTYRTCSTGLHGYEECLFFSGSCLSDKTDNLEWRTSHGFWGMSLTAKPHLYIGSPAVYWAHSAASKCHFFQCYDFEWPMNSSSHFV
jgi:hypothetical protein